MSRSIVDCALYTLPPPGVDYVSAVPMQGSQRKAFAVMAVLGSTGDTCGVNISDQGETKGERRKRMEEETTTPQTHLFYETKALSVGNYVGEFIVGEFCCWGITKNNKLTSTLIYKSSVLLLWFRPSSSFTVEAM